VEKSTQNSKLSSGAKNSTSVCEQLRLLLVYSMMSKGIQKYIETISKERKELAKREEIIQGELDKIENLVTNFIMPSVEVVLLKLEALKKMSKQREKYEIIGLDYKTIEGVIMEFFLLYQKYEELNLSIVETKLDIKNLYVFINKNSLKFASNTQPEDAELALNSLNKYIFDYNRLLKLLDSDSKLDLKPKNLLSSCTSPPSPSSLTSPAEAMLKNLVGSTSPSKLLGLLQTARQRFSLLAGRMSETVSPYFGHKFQMGLASGESKVLDLFIEVQEESKMSYNLCDAKRVHDLLVAVNYWVGGRWVMVVFLQKGEAEIGHFAAVQLPDDYEVAEAIFVGGGKLLVLLKSTEGLNRSVVGTMNYVELMYFEVKFKEDKIDLEQAILEKLSIAGMNKFKFEEDKSHIIDNINTSNLSSSGSNLFSVLVQKRKLVFYHDA
jgi:hypothetical protein